MLLAIIFLLLQLLIFLFYRSTPVNPPIIAAKHDDQISVMTPSKAHKLLCSVEPEDAPVEHVHPPLSLYKSPFIIEVTSSRFVGGLLNHAKSLHKANNTWRNSVPAMYALVKKHSAQTQKYAMTMPRNTKSPVVLYGKELASSMATMALRRELGDLQFHNMVKHGNIVDWNNVVEAWNDLYKLNEINGDPSEHALIITESPWNETGTRQKMIQVAFETLGVPAIYIANSQNVMLQGTNSNTTRSGARSGIVIDIGENCTFIVPVYYGTIIQHGIVRTDIGGKHIDEFLLRRMTEKGHSLEYSQKNYQQAEEFKKEHCYVLPFNRTLLEEENTAVKCFNLDLNESSALLTQERYLCPELLFNPMLNHISNTMGIMEAFWTSCDKLGDEACKQFLMMENSNSTTTIVVTGGTSMLSGLAQRIQGEIQTKWKHLKVTCAPKYNSREAMEVFVNSGGLTDAQFISRAEYEELGFAVITKI